MEQNNIKSCKGMKKTEIEEITLFAQPRTHKLCTEDFKDLKIKEINNKSEKKNFLYMQVLVPIFLSIVSILVVLYFLIPLLTVITGSEIYSMITAVTIVVVLSIPFMFALNSWFKKKGMIGAYIVPDVFERILEYPIKNSNKRFDVKGPSKFMPQVYWEGTLSTTINNRPFEIIFQYVNIDKYTLGGGANPSNNVCVIKLKADKDELRSFIRYLADTPTEPWKIERKEKFTEKFDISLSEVKERWMKYIG